MGNAASTVELPGEGAGTPEKPGDGIKLYEYIRGTSTGQWELVSDSAAPSFYDTNEDNEDQPASWFLELDAAGIDEKLGEEFEFQESDRRCTFVAANKIWAMKFPTRATFQAFYTRYQDCLFENTFEMTCDDTNKEKVFTNSGLLGREGDESRQQWEEDVDETEAPSDHEFRDKSTPLKTPARIHNVRMGAGINSYLVRDNAVEVMRNVRGGVEDTGISFNLTPAKGSAFTPSRLILARGETQMNMLTPGRRESVFQADIETGKVVNEWSFQKDGVEVPMLDISNDTKSAQLEQRDTFLGLDKNRLARWDMRTSQGLVQQINSPSVVSYVGGKDYSGRPRFSCMATSGDGYVVVGSEDGTIRLYSEKTLTRASTAIPGLGSPITSVDVTFDGRWVVATTRNYLMVVKTSFNDTKTGKATNGFKARMGSTSPKPRLLRLKTEDVSRVGPQVPLEKGKFTWITEAGRQERWIVASCGNYTVLWNFRQVKLTQPDVVSYGGLTTCTNYHLIPKAEHVVDSVFMHDNYAASPAMGESAMVVVTDNCVWTVGGDEEDEEED